jgi:hypothetical protein
MRFGVWTPLPHTIRPEPRMQDAIAELSTPGAGSGLDGSYQFALDVVAEAEAAGFDSTLIAQRYLGPDLDAWMLASALAARTKTIEIMPAVHPGIVLPQLVAKFGASLDRISQPGERLVGRRVQYVRQRFLDRGSAGARPTYGRVPDSPEGTVDHESVQLRG